MKVQLLICFVISVASFLLNYSPNSFTTLFTIVFYLKLKILLSFFDKYLRKKLYLQLVYCLKQHMLNFFQNQYLAILGNKSKKLLIYYW